MNERGEGCGGAGSKSRVSCAAVYAGCCWAYSRRRRGVVDGVEQDQSLPSAVLQGCGALLNIGRGEEEEERRGEWKNM